MPWNVGSVQMDDVSLDAGSIGEEPRKHHTDLRHCVSVRKEPADDLAYGGGSFRASDRRGASVALRRVRTPLRRLLGLGD